MRRKSRTKKQLPPPVAMAVAVVVAGLVAGSGLVAGLVAGSGLVAGLVAGWWCKG